ncbi:hypothetical protein [Streptomyces sp. NPDC093109]|uniref:hypothetical protein n=1 Tax=Streptomyces sp. NPDC093109 TaxID=3154977 RepID=UPI00344B738B
MADCDGHFHGAVGAGQVVEVVREVSQHGRPVVLLLNREQCAEGGEVVVGRARSQVPVQQLTELRDRIGGVRQQFVAAVRSCRALHDLSGQTTRVRAAVGETHQRWQGGETGGRYEVMFKEQPVSQLLPRFGAAAVL